MRRAVLAGVAVMSALAVAAAQSTQPAFDVASVKENTSVSDGSSISGPLPGRFRITNTPLRFILLHAFQVLDHQLIGAPGWTESARFDITGTYPGGATPSDPDTRAMLRTLLADRFALVTHRETRELPMYALVLARKDGALGPQLVRSSIDCERWLKEKRPQIGEGSPSPVAPGGKRPVCLMLTTRRLITAGTRSMPQLAASLQALTGRSVVDRTGLTGTFDFDLQWTSGTVGTPVGTNPQPDDGPSIFAALQEQLGLRLEPGRATFDVVVVDAVGRPTPD
jgi:uncharacterized protein (TIGR03435 family)